MERLERRVPPLSEPAQWSMPVFPQWQKCPVCLGTGTVGHDFYAGLGMGTSTERVTCRTCRGRTVIAPPGIAGSPQEPGAEEGSTNG